MRWCHWQAERTARGAAGNRRTPTSLTARGSMASFGLDERIGGASAVDPRISRSLLRPFQRPLGRRRCSAAIAVCLLALGPAEAAHGAGPRPDLPPAAEAPGSPQPELPPRRARTSPPPAPTHTTPATTHRTVAPRPARIAPVTVRSQARGPAAVRSHRTARRTPSPPPPRPRRKGPYLFPPAAVWREVAQAGPPRDALALVGLAALVLAFGSGSLVLTLRQLRTA
jgi:hypothetical protein